MTIRFDEAWQRAVALSMNLTDTNLDLVLVRDLLGRVCLVIDPPSGFDLDAADLARRLTEATGPAFVASVPIVDLAVTGFPAEYFEPPTVTVVRERTGVSGRLALLENGLAGAPWRTVAETPSRRRVTLYSFKGGVGRSTATFMLARALAEQGRCVLVVDLDLESPGVGNLLLSEQARPEHGLVDHLAESLVGNQSGLDLVARSTSVSTTGNGEVWVAPAGGRPRDGYTYLPRLNRAYLDSADHSFSQRVDAAVTTCERAVGELDRPPDHVLLDSRAGIHDIAAVAITDLADFSLLFATDSPQTWSGYTELLGQWRSSPREARMLRERLRMVAAMVPATVRIDTWKASATTRTAAWRPLCTTTHVPTIQRRTTPLWRIRTPRTVRYRSCSARTWSLSTRRSSPAGTSRNSSVPPTARSSEQSATCCQGPRSDHRQPTAVAGIAGQGAAVDSRRRHRASRPEDAVHSGDAPPGPGP
jgi:MinD-like ATPase involved in chromosome partitioning or flagellar assembly